MVLPRARVAAFLTLALYGLLTFAATLQSNILTTSNTSSSYGVKLSAVDVPSNGNEYANCFDPAEVHRELYQAKEEDCFNALQELFDFIKDPFRPLTFAQSSHDGFQLPMVVQNGTCVISIDVSDGDDSADTADPSIVYATARELVLRCTQGGFHFGGRNTTGPKGVVDVEVFGKAWSLGNGVSEQVAFDRAVVAGKPLTKRGSSLLNETSLRLIEPTVAKPANQDDGINSNVTELGVGLQCWDPPLPRERAWPIVVKHCEKASEEMFEGRQRYQMYTFSREVVATRNYFRLPATFRYKTCVVHLDVKSDGDQDAVKLSIVEATAFVLAHKCSGEEQPVERYGGHGTVGAGTKGLINVWVYARPWPPLFGVTNVTNLIPAQTSSLLDSK